MYHLGRSNARALERRRPIWRLPGHVAEQGVDLGVPFVDRMKL